ncbi:purine-nucleoside phosphorylase [Infirmifilum lucidum]|uniref:Purine-nucleoside phosphorylase n=1 Tax=Infirmifilum lucidum TaxID=2776706 RepID=A0A7L9FFG1_9CREN|nr:purine-nucleoside phosphorylase [Infirmifilum lucidum]QOJ78548.1 purine-nucleoside phosphorylase [Infirmifilum lucidum]
MAKPLHILAKPGDIAPRVVASGDPARVKQLSTLLEDARLVNENRGFLVYTGKWRGVDVTVATHGIGAPSAAIVFEELIMLGAKLIVRFGTCGGFLKEMRVGDFVIATGASYVPGGTLNTYTRGDCLVAVPDYEVLKSLVEKAEERGLRYFLGPVISSDNFYAGVDFLNEWIKRGMIAVDMEAATLMVLSRIRGVKAGAAFVVSDVIGEVYAKMATAEELREAVDKASRAVLDAVVSVKI